MNGRGSMVDRVTRPPPTPNTVGTTAHPKGGLAQDQEVPITGTEETDSSRGEK